MSEARKYARQLVSAWAASRSEEECFPVNCTEIADGFDIVVHEGEDLGEEFQGALFLQDGLKAIIYNDKIKEDGRKNFTVAHELGHFFLHKDRKELKCSMDDLETFDDQPPHGKEIEREANEFAANLLMPARDIGPYLKNNDLDLNLVETLSDRYGTSMTSTAFRIVEVTGKPSALLMLDDDGVVLWCKRNDAFQGFFVRKGFQISSPLQESQSSYECTQKAWMPSSQYEKWLCHQSVLHMSNYDKYLVLITGEAV